MTPDAFIKEIFNEENGKTSFARIGSFMCLVAGIAWVSFLVFKNHALPDFSGLVAFIGVPYGTNKFATAISTYLNKAQNG